ncbi:MAG: hypothetical protein JRF36_17635 [Deltaproteobacteria bacterium]|jgi:hypothetical protein|nr:hypothetical protein [Deltaproteobacteria bacterium]MBW2470216.1 hypothetical protein [Deltaproteobacteria bacterium]
MRYIILLMPMTGYTGFGPQNVHFRPHLTISTTEMAPGLRAMADVFAGMSESFQRYTFKEIWGQLYKAVSLKSVHGYRSEITS